MSKKTVKNVAETVKTIKTQLSAAQMKIVLQQLDNLKWRKQQELNEAENKEKGKYNPLISLLDDLKTDKAKKQVLEDVCDYIRACNHNCGDGYVPVKCGSKTDQLLTSYKEASRAKRNSISEQFKRKYDDLLQLVDSLKLRIALATSYDEVAQLLDELKNFEC